MPKRTLLRLILLLTLLCMFPNTMLRAQEEPLRVVVKPLEPFVIDSSSAHAGFSIEL